MSQMSFACAVAAAGLSVCVSNSVQAAWTYYDVDTNNTVNAADSGVAWNGGSDTTFGWRDRAATGPAGPAYPAGNGTAYTGRLGVSQSGVDDPNLLTTFTGLDPSTAYNVRVYGVYPNNATSRHFAQVSTDGGTTLEFLDNRYNNNTDANAGPVGLPIVWVDASNNGLGAELAGGRGTDPATFGDTRYYTPLTQTVMSDANGNASILLSLPLTNPDFSGNQDRFNLDGYALEAAVPEPASLGLLGLGGLALVRRRRK